MAEQRALKTRSTGCRAIEGSLCRQFASYGENQQLSSLAGLFPKSSSCTAGEHDYNNAQMHLELSTTARTLHVYCASHLVGGLGSPLLVREQLGARREEHADRFAVPAWAQQHTQMSLHSAAVQKGSQRSNMIDELPSAMLLWHRWWGVDPARQGNSFFKHSAGMMVHRPESLHLC